MSERAYSRRQVTLLALGMVLARPRRRAHAAGSSAKRSREELREEALRDAVVTAVPLGEQVVVTSDAEPLGLPGERTGSLHHGWWSGSMRVSVERAELFQDLERAGAAYGLGCVCEIRNVFEPVENFRYLVASIGFSNINARPVHSVWGTLCAYPGATALVGDDSCGSMFSASDFRVLALEDGGFKTKNMSGEASSYGGCLWPEAANAGAMPGYLYEVAPGNEVTLTLGWWVPADIDLSRTYFYLDYVTSSALCPEILFALSPDKAGTGDGRAPLEDARGEDEEPVLDKQKPV